MVNVIFFVSYFNVKFFLAFEQILDQFGHLVNFLPLF